MVVFCSGTGEVASFLGEYWRDFFSVGERVVAQPSVGCCSVGSVMVGEIEEWLCV